jgi:hypothetical protein
LVVGFPAAPKNQPAHGLIANPRRTNGSRETPFGLTVQASTYTSL